MYTDMTPGGRFGSAGNTPSNVTSSARRRGLLWAPLGAIAAAAFAVEIPFFFYGSPSGHDFEFHLYTWLEVLSQWKVGIVYPRWAALAHFAYGEPRFLFYPPASWTLGAALSAIFPWTLVPSLYIWLVLVAAGASMFLLARQWLHRRDATFAAVLYAANPYHVVIVYWRSAFAELLVSALLPLLLLVLLRPEKNNRTTVLSLSLIMAAAWLTDIPAAVMLTYSLALMLVVAAVVHRSARPLAIGAISVLLGLALAAFYVVPVVYEKKWVEIAQVLSPGVRPQDNFLFTSLNYPDHDRFNMLISLISVAEIIL